MPEWMKLFEATLKRAARKAGVSVEALKFEGCTTDQTWGDRCGLVFYGAAPEVNERAAKFFERWARKHLHKLGVIGGYERQQSITFEGPFHYTAYSNGAQGWYRGAEGKAKTGDVEHFPASELGKAWDLVCTETRQGFATSYVYYPCAD